MDRNNIIGNRVMNKHTRSIGIIKNVTETHVEIDYHGDICCLTLTVKAYF